MISRIALTMGDPGGIGPEIILKSLSRLKKRKAALIVVGAPGAFSQISRQLQIPFQPHFVESFEDPRATNRDLNSDMESGRFREDLFYRIAVYPITVPPLRDRRDDIPILVQHFVQHFARRRGGSRIDQVPAEVMRRLQTYDWPGNVRELQNVVERAALTSTDEVLRLAEPLKSNSNGKVATRETGLDVPGLTLDEVERRYIIQVLEAVQGQVSGAGGAAEILGLHANTLRYRMKKLGISVGRKTGDVTIDS